MNRFVKNVGCFAPIAFVVLVAGCASGPNFKTYSPTVPPPKEGQSRVWFYRPSTMFGTAVQPVVKINDAPLYKAQPGCFFYADEAPGKYEIKCSTEWADKGDLTVVENKTAYIKLEILPGLFVGHILPKQVSEEQGLKEIQGCHLITADGLNKDWKPPTQ
jgi:hypothetical protein